VDTHHPSTLQRGFESRRKRKDTHKENGKKLKRQMEKEKEKRERKQERHIDRDTERTGVKGRDANDRKDECKEEEVRRDKEMKRGRQRQW
jgi:hypothetical protein